MTDGEYSLKAIRLKAEEEDELSLESMKGNRLLFTASHYFLVLPPESEAILLDFLIKRHNANNPDDLIEKAPNKLDIDLFLKTVEAHEKLQEEYSTLHQIAYEEIQNLRWENERLEASLEK